MTRWQETLETSQDAFYGAAVGQPAQGYVCQSAQGDHFVIFAHGEWSACAATEEEVNAFLLARGINPQTNWRGQW